MSRFAIKFPYFIIVVCLMVCVIGTRALVKLPVDLFPNIKIPVVVVATFYSGMPPEQIENDITIRRQVPADHGLCRSAQTGGPPIERHGCGPLGQREQPHPPGG